MPEFTPTQQLVIDALSDGKPHLKQELRDVLGCEEDDYNKLRVTISNLRIRLRPIGQDIVCRVQYRRIYYQHVRLLNSSE